MILMSSFAYRRIFIVLTTLKQINFILVCFETAHTLANRLAYSSFFLHFFSGHIACLDHSGALPFGVGGHDLHRISILGRFSGACVTRPTAPATGFFFVHSTSFLSSFLPLPIFSSIIPVSVFTSCCLKNVV